MIEYLLSYVDFVNLYDSIPLQHHSYSATNISISNIGTIWKYDERNKQQTINRYANEKNHVSEWYHFIY